MYEMYLKKIWMLDLFVTQGNRKGLHAGFNYEKHNW